LGNYCHNANIRESWGIDFGNTLWLFNIAMEAMAHRNR